MQRWHCIILGVLVGYILAMYFPQFGQQVKAKLSA